MADFRRLVDLSELKPDDWTSEELAFYHEVLSDVSPWLNEQGNHIHHQIVDELVSRKQGT
ncbi:hypothetical protein MJA45_03305 [Paenibacillus aurantius]|uniref:Cytosolic protein n=1 Tax=Paenibacillus aurantius TaxID=2918900 RepID=A0AA96RGA0_9BACL|nr:hypothetical protein [Paenibacillus aurantius]WNQ12103.1 hypothetical protein MJA45_03305 [Paenibacillus aurantius]